MSIAFHSLLRILLISPVRIIWLAADTSGLRFLAKIMKAFMGRFGVPSALRDWAIRESAKAEPSLSSVVTIFVELSGIPGEQKKCSKLTVGVSRLELRWEGVRRVVRVGTCVI